MSNAILRAFAAGIIFSSALIAGFYYGNDLHQDRTITAMDAKKMLEEQDYIVMKETAAINKAEPTSEKEVKQETVEASNNIAKKQEQQKKAVKTYTLQVKYKMTVQEIAETLATEKIIDDAAGFQNYMNKNGLTRRVQVDEFVVTSDMSYEELGHLLTH
ncbi:hypothetical protein D1953_02375 [Peribacillus asahii]|uniref:Aminodeoxychorismate lyase n=1 Tax=Peribacillus asahii TaxID=228899 RepID=A0A398BIT3_9BACI|nr:hypothetical protein [Peribacillus asahii]RID89427.1 hypothetical protein D1953_02375 [Peribacillus asahii]